MEVALELSVKQVLGSGCYSSLSATVVLKNLSIEAYIAVLGTLLNISEVKKGRT